MTQGNKVNSINQLLYFEFSVQLILYHLHGGCQSLCLSPAVKSLIWTQLDTVDCVPLQITLQAVDKILAISPQFKKNKSHLSREIKIERRIWHQQQQQQKLIDMGLNVSGRGQEIVSVCAWKETLSVFYTYRVTLEDSAGTGL